MNISRFICGSSSIQSTRSSQEAKAATSDSLETCQQEVSLKLKNSSEHRRSILGRLMSKHPKFQNVFSKFLALGKKVGLGGISVKNIGGLLVATEKGAKGKGGAIDIINIGKPVSGEDDELGLPESFVETLDFGPERPFGVDRYGERIVECYVADYIEMTAERNRAASKEERSSSSPAVGGGSVGVDSRDEEAPRRRTF